MGELLPNAQEARIDPRKLRDYVLDFSHPSGRFKAAFFALMGYSVENWQCLVLDIREQHLIELAERGSPSPFGRKYNFTALLTGPSGQSRWVITVWIFRQGEIYPDLVTVEPANRRRSIENE